MNKQLYKGSLQTIILKLLEDNGQMYGYEITQKVKAMTNAALLITEGALYPALHKLEADGLLQSEFKNIGNRKRKYYKLTPKGTKETVKKIDELAQFMATLDQIFAPKKQPGLEI